jgi:predicted DNA-binding transcriptional regulator AlpA
MPDRIAALLGFPPTLDASDLLHVEDLGHVLGVSQREALKLTQREDFPEPFMHRHRYIANERAPQPRPVWDRAEVERWAKEVNESRRQAAAG